MDTYDIHATLRTFRDSFYECLERRTDALFELADALLTAGTVPSPPHLSLTAAHSRGWGSLYAALGKGRMDAEILGDLLSEHPSTGIGAKDRSSVFAVGVSAWPRCDAEASPQRGYYYHLSRHSAGQPILAGWAYQLVAGLGFERDSWIAPMDARRVPPEEDANEVAAEQVRALVRRLVRRDIGDGEAPLFLFDAGYNPVRLQKRLEGCRAQILVRLHSGRAFYADPSAPKLRLVGRPLVHGKKFDLKDQNTWHEPSAEHASEDAGYGEVRVRAWTRLHPKTRRAGKRYGSDSAAVVRGTVVLVEVERLPRSERRRKPKKLWLWWHGEGEPDLDLLWRSYIRRFDVEHFVRFLKQSLGWTTPRVRHPEQADRWTWLLLAARTASQSSKSASVRRTRQPFNRSRNLRRSSTPVPFPEPASRLGAARRAAPDSPPPAD